ncbi:unnamed protein product [Rotaria sp. Silwood1]|nr:unnamed protein product [Rotaria sp. Silwood1]
MQLGKSKLRTIMSFFSPSSPKKRLNDQELHHSSTLREISRQLVLSEVTDLLSIVDSNTNLHSGATAIYDKSISTSLTSYTSSLSAQTLFIIRIDTSRPLVDPLPSILSTCLISPIVVPIDVNCSSVNPSSQPTSLSISLITSSRPADISRSLFDPPVQSILPSYKINKESRSFQKQWSSNKGNLLEILQWSSETDSVVFYLIWLKNKVYALLADESRDISGYQQMSIVLRVIDDTKIKESNNFIEKYFIDLIALHSFDAKPLADAIVNILRKFNIDLCLCIVMCFDG